MVRIHKLRRLISRLVQARLRGAEGTAARTGGFLSSMSPPNKLQDLLLRQALTSGLLDNVAMLAPLGSIPTSASSCNLRTAYLSCTSKRKEPLFLDRNSFLNSRDPRRLPQWICFVSLERKLRRDGSPIAVMKRVTSIDPAWLSEVAIGSKLLDVGAPLQFPPPTYDIAKDAIVCSIATKYGCYGWEVPPVKLKLSEVLSDVTSKGTQLSVFDTDDCYRWFARFLLEGRVLPELKPFAQMLNDNPSVITRKISSKKVLLLVSALEAAGVSSGCALRRHWATVDKQFLFTALKAWVKSDRIKEAQKLWIEVVNQAVKEWAPLE